MINPIVVLVPVGGLLFWLMSQKKGGTMPPVIDASGKVVITPPVNTNTGFPGPFTPGTFPPIAPPYPPQGNTTTPTGVTNVQDAISKAIASGSPAVMLALADTLESQGLLDAATNLRNIARAIQANTAINQAATDAAGKILSTGTTPGTAGTTTAGGPGGTGIVPARYALAQAVAMHLRKVRKGSEDKMLIANFQRQEGLRADGLYGPATAAAFAKYGLTVPAPFYGAGATVPTAPPIGPFGPSTGTVPASASTNLQRAQAVAANIATSSRGRENKSLVASFQRQERLNPDGLYGRSTAAAVARYGINAPPPIYGAASGASVPPPPMTQTASTSAVMQLAQMVALMLSKVSRGREDRALVARFQSAVGLAPDGLYGRGTAAALSKFGITPPTPFY